MYEANITFKGDSPMITLCRDAVLAMLYAYGALKFGGLHRLKWHNFDPEAPSSYFYADIRKERVDPVVLQAIGRYMGGSLHHMLDLNEGQKWCVVGVPNGGVELAQGFVKNIHEYSPSGVVLGTPLEKVGEGVDRHIQIIPRTLLSELPICLIENVITTAASTIEAVKALRRYGAKVLKVGALLDRQLGGMEALDRLGVEVEACLTVKQLIDFLFDTSLVSDEVARNALLNLQDMQLYLKQQAK